MKNYNELVVLLESKIELAKTNTSDQILLLNGYINAIPENGFMILIKVAPKEDMVKIREYMINRRNDLRKSLNKI